MSIMRLPRRTFLHLAAGVAALPAISRIASAQAYPSRPIRLILGFAAGGSADIVARLIAQFVSDRIGQPVIVENRTGASSNLAGEAVARSAPDGYTLLYVTTVNAINATFFDNLKFDLKRDFAPVSGVTRAPNVLEVNPSVPANNVAEFVAYAKANPGKLNMASTGNGTSIHLAGELFKAMTGTNLVHVPYRSPPQAMTDLLAGQVQVMFDVMTQGLQHIKEGRLRALAVTTAARSDALPEVPTVAETVPGYEASSWSGVCAPSGTPAGIVEMLNKEINAALTDPTIKARLASIGSTAITGSPAEFATFLTEETDKWGKVVRAANIKAE
jgi:tripartite-type tricarboxylate transporter receptor subunit TctC